MARARLIKPALFKNEILGVADPILSLLFAGLWCLADREGRLEDRHLRIKAELFPYREITAPLFNGYLTELQRLGFIRRFKVGDAAIIQVLNFTKHQTPHKTEKDSELPEEPPESRAKPCSSEITVKAPLNNDGLTEQERPLCLMPCAFDFKPCTLNLEPCTDIPIHTDNPKKPKKDASGYSPEFLIFWNLYPERPGASKAAAWKQWKARIKAGADSADILSGTKRYADYIARNQTEPQYIKQPATFLGPDLHYQAAWAEPAKQFPQLSKAGSATALAAQEFLKNQAEKRAREAEKNAG